MQLRKNPRKLLYISIWNNKRRSRSLSLFIVEFEQSHCQQSSSILEIHETVKCHCAGAVTAAIAVVQVLVLQI